MRQAPTVAVVVDSAASLPSDEACRLGLRVVPMRLTLGAKTYLDGRDLTVSEFYHKLRESKVTPSTSPPPPAGFMEAFVQAAEVAASILCITVSSRFSSSFGSATAALQEAKELLPGVEIRVMDSGSAAGGEGLIALEAQRVANRGGNLDHVVAAAKTVAQRVRLLAFPDTLYYLWKSGRVPGIAHAGAALLDIKPLFELAQGEIRTVARTRSRRRAGTRLVELMRLGLTEGSVHATVMHADAAEAAQGLKQQVEAEIACEDLFISEITPVMGAHIGPGLLGVAFWSK